MRRHAKWPQARNERARAPASPSPGEGRKARTARLSKKPIHVRLHALFVFVRPVSAGFRFLIRLDGGGLAGLRRLSTNLELERGTPRWGIRIVHGVLQMGFVTLVCRISANKL